MNTLMNDFLRRSKLHDSNIIYVQMYKNGILKAEYKRFPVKTRLEIWSIAKAFTSMGAGIALNERIISIDEAIYPVFESYFPENPPENLYKIRVRDLLTMSSGLSAPLFFCDDPERYQVKDWIHYFFHHGDFKYEPGIHFCYSNFNSYILSATIETRTGQNLLEYLRYRLFEPLSIGNPDWTLCPMGHCKAANGLYTTIDELSNLGHLILNAGEFNGKQIVPAEYIREACKKQIDSLVPRTGWNDYERYGYGFMLRPGPIPGTIISAGNYGQCCIVDFIHNTVITVMSLDGNHHQKIKNDMIDAMADYYGIKIQPPDSAEITF